MILEELSTNELCLLWWNKCIVPVKRSDEICNKFYKKLKNNINGNKLITEREYFIQCLKDKFYD